MANLPGLRLVRPSDVETMVFDWGTIKWMSEPRVTHTSGFTLGVVLLEPGKGRELSVGLRKSGLQPGVSQKQ